MITIEVKDREVLDLLGRLTQGMADLTPVMANVALGLASESERQFATESGAFGGWPDLADSTKAARRKKGLWPGQILQVSAGGLAASVQTAYGPNFASIGSNKPYSAIHMFGGDAGRGHASKIPARPYLPFNPQTNELTEPAKKVVMDVLELYFSRLAS